jgi:hypothetical protein
MEFVEQVLVEGTKCKDLGMTVVDNISFSPKYLRLRLALHTCS